MLCRNEVRIQYSEGISDTKLSDAWPGHWEGLSLPMLIAHSVSTFLVISLSLARWVTHGHTPLTWSQAQDQINIKPLSSTYFVVSAVQQCYAIYYLRCIVGNMLMLIWEKLYLDYNLRI